MKVGRMFINGKWKTAVGGATREIFNPANNKVIAVVTEGSKKDAELAIKAARKAFDEGPWPQMRAGERASYLFKLADLIEAERRRAREDSRRATTASRCARRSSTSADAAACFRYYAGLITKPLGQTYEVSRPDDPADGRARADRRLRADHPVELSAAHGGVETRARPRGGKLLHPQSRRDDAAHGHRAVRADRRSRLSPGAAQFSSARARPSATRSRRACCVDKIAFTGGTVTGRKIMAAATGNIKKVTLELGGKSPVHRFRRRRFRRGARVRDVRASSPGQGEVCSAGSRLILEKKIAERFLAAPRGGEREDRRRRRPGSEDRDGPADHAPAHGARARLHRGRQTRKARELICGGERLTDGRWRRATSSRRRSS